MNNNNPNQTKFKFLTVKKVHSADLKSKNLDYKFRTELSAQIKQFCKNNNCDRYEIAVNLSRLLGKDIGKNQIDGWTSPAREDHKFPLTYLPAMCKVLKSNYLLKYISKFCECVVLDREEAKVAELGLITREMSSLKERESELKAKGIGA